MDVSHWNLPSGHPYRYDGSLFGGPNLWNPSEITTEAWYDASALDTITESSGAVSQWDDLSGNGNHLAQGSVSLKPTTGTATIGGLNAIDFYANALANASLPNSIGTYTMSIFMVAEVDSLNNAYMFNLKGTEESYNIVNSTSRMGINYPALYTGSTDAHVLSYVLPSARNRQDVWRNGTLAGTSTDIRGTMTSVTELYVGARASNGAYAYDGRIGELIFIESGLSESDRQKLEGYLAWKWGLEANLPSGHPYKDTAPTV